MADKSTATTDREKDIADKIRNACLPTNDATDAVFANKDAIQALNEGLGKSKLAIMAQVAKMSDEDKWLPGEIKNATAYAATIGNADPKDRTAKSLAVFMSEMNVVAHPKVRNRFPTLLDIVETVWAHEDQLIKAETGIVPPVRKWASRKAHALMNVLRAVKDSKADINTPEDLIDYATVNDPDFNAERVAKRLEAVAKTLHGIFVDFGNEDIGHAENYLNAIKVDHLIQSREIKLAKERAAAKEHRNLKPGNEVKKVTPVVTPATTSKPVSTPVATQEPEPMHVVEGVFDPLAETLNDAPDDAAALVEAEIQRLAA